MNKFFKVLSVGALALTLAACNSSATPTKDTTKTSKLTLEQVYEKAVERQADIKSSSAKMEMTQDSKVEAGEQSMEFSIDTKMDMDLVTDPLSMHVSGSMTMPDMANEGKTSSEMPIDLYMKKDQGIFMKDSASGTWFKLPDEQLDTMLEENASSANAKAQLDQLKDFIKDFKFEQTDDAYILTLDAKGDKFKELIDSQINKSMKDMGLESNPLDNLTIDKIHYTLEIDKKTFDTNKVDMNFDLKMKIEDQELATKTKSVVTYTEFNQLKTIDIPQEVIDNAQSIPQ